MEDIKMWWEEQTRFKEDRVVVKILNRDKSFRKSVITPTVYYPLSGDYKVFHYGNTKLLASLEDDVVTEIFNSIPYQVGFCYQNTDALVSALREKGYDAKSYVGWLFMGSFQFPVHHCWCVLNNEIVLDLADDFSVMLSGENGKKFKNMNQEESRELLVDFAKWAKSLPNIQRCAPVGTPTPFMLYVGCECTPQEGRNIYNRLIDEFPDHECQRNCDSRGVNATQRRMMEEGLM